MEWKLRSFIFKPYNLHHFKILCSLQQMNLKDYDMQHHFLMEVENIVMKKSPISIARHPLMLDRFWKMLKEVIW